MIILTPYNPTWPILFEEEKRKLQQILKDETTHIEHIGSTAIPGIYAKPIIDIQIGVNNINEFDSDKIKKIERLGYHYNKQFEAEFPNRRYFQKNDNQGNRTHQIHLVNYPSAWWEKLILFRNYLRNFPKIATEYSMHKLKLAKEFDESIAYANAKTEFCQNIDKLAYFDFRINKPFITTANLNGYIIQPVCFDIYKKMFQEPEFINCFGVAMSDEQLQKILIRDTSFWDKYGFAPLVWFDKTNHKFVGEGGLNHTIVEDRQEIELTYSLSKDCWGKGLAVEIGEFAINYAFNILKLDSIVCFTMTKNHRSLKVMHKLNFTYEKNFIHFDLLHSLFRLKS